MSIDLFSLSSRVLSSHRKSCLPKNHFLLCNNKPSPLFTNSPSSSILRRRCSGHNNKLFSTPMSHREEGLSVGYLIDLSNNSSRSSSHSHSSNEILPLSPRGVCYYPDGRRPKFTPEQTKILGHNLQQVLAYAGRLFCVRGEFVRKGEATDRDVSSGSLGCSPSRGRAKVASSDTVATRSPRVTPCKLQLARSSLSQC